MKPNKRKRDEDENNSQEKSCRKSESKRKSLEMFSDQQSNKKVEIDVQMKEEVAIEATKDKDLLKVFDDTVKDLQCLKTKLKSRKKEQSIVNFKKIKDHLVK